MSIPVLTIDGPSGAGKGTVSRAVAKKLGWNYLDSGAIYRAVAIHALNKQCILEHGDVVAHYANKMDLSFECGDTLIVRLEGVDITAQLPTEEVGAVASQIAAHPEVRAVLLRKQQNFQQAPGLVADGRDMGTVVFAEADFKVFLTASAEERGLRRFKQLQEKGMEADLEKITQDIELRDRRDSERKNSPLIPADDALYLDSSDLSIDEVIARVLALVN
ncbi:MAG: (d)CMP kinase [Methyloprofundus sp.]|nr:(d)CMP kinase [Methyloprofundus sp.]